jgi:recombination protein RecA
VDKDGDLLSAAVEYGVVEKSGAWYSHDNERIGQGLNNAARAVGKNPALRAQISKAVRAKMGGGA